MNSTNLAPVAGTVGSLASRAAFIGPLIYFSIVFVIWMIIAGIVTAINRSIDESKNKNTPNYKYKMPLLIVIMWIIAALIFAIGLIVVILVAVVGNKYSKEIGDTVGTITQTVGGQQGLGGLVQSGGLLQGLGGQGGQQGFGGLLQSLGGGSGTAGLAEEIGESVI
jgi:uncharacterized membrane protein